MAFVLGFRMSQNTFDINSVRQIEALKQAVGSLDECKRLGFIFEDQQGIMSLSVAGLGFLLYVDARGIANIPEAFAAGYTCARDEIEAKD
jgi:hypothetical protein